MDDKIVKQLAVTWELINHQPLGKFAADMIVAQLDTYPAELVKKALSRCLVEVKGRLSPAEIISRIDDGWPSSDEAWALVPKSENLSTVWCDEIADAWYQVQKLHAGEWDADTQRRGPADPVAARMSFKSIYEKAVIDSRASRRAPKWWLSRGLGGADTHRVLLDAVNNGRLTAEEALAQNPELRAKRISDSPPELTEHGSNRGLDEQTKLIIAEAKKSIDGIVKKMTLPNSKSNGEV